MCGISGIVNFHNFEDKKNSVEKLKLMTKRLRNRGPDSIGYTFQDQFLFGHTRLSIIDLSSHGNQPMSVDNGRLTITFNGEIYNFKTVREDLIKRGYVFKSNSDTEVILNGYLAYGLENLLNMCDGFWSFALFDNHKNKLFLCKDRFGKKPLFYTMVGNYLYFSSTTQSLKPILKTKNLNKDIVKDYLNIGFVPHNKCIIKNIDKVLPGTFIEVSKKSLITKKYWDVKLNDIESISEQDALSNIEYLLTKSVKNRLVADVDVGSFLSGGLDSAIITALASKLKKNIDSYTMTIPGSSLDEEYGAKITSDHLKINHKLLKIDSEIFKNLESAASAYSEPFGDSSLLPMQMLSAMASKHKKVILTGDGGDEGFNAYGRYYFYNQIIRNKKNKVSNFFLSNLGNFFWNYPPAPFAMRGRYRSHNWMVQGSGVEEYISSNWQLLNSTLSQILFSDSKNYVPYTNKYIDEILSPYDDLDDRRKIMYSGLEFELPGDFLVKLDTGSMHNGLELRSPFLDHNLIQFLMNVPTNVWGSSGKKKLLEKLILNNLPKELLTIPKRGFSFPLEEYITNLWVVKIDELFENPLIVELGYIKKSGLKKIYEWAKYDKNTDWRIIRLIFCLISFEYWIRNWEAE